MRRIVLLALCAACSSQPTTTQIRALEAGTPPAPVYTRNVLDAVTNGAAITIAGTCPTTPCFVPPPNNPSGVIDSYAGDVYERPIGKGAAAALYYPALDIQSTDTGMRPSWVYYRVNLVGTDAGALPHAYRVEINFDADANGDAIVELDAPSSTDWSSSLVVRVDDNASVGGARALVADGPAQAGGGYEQVVFAAGVNSAPGAEGGSTAVQVRVSAASIELAIYRPFLESLTSDTVTGAGFRAYASLASINAGALYVHDDRSRSTLGSPYPWLETAGAPTTCPTGPGGDDGLTAAQVASLESGTRLDTGIPNPCYAVGSTYEFDNAGSLASLANKADITFDVDLALAITDAPDPVVEDQPLTYSLTVTNVTPGAGNAQNVVVTSTLPATAAYVSAFPGCTHAAGIVTCVIGTLANGAATAVSITVVPSTPGPITHAATVTSDGDEVTPANNTASAVTTVLSANPMCGDGNTDPGEMCDDGNPTPNDGCENDCTLSIACGNGVVQGTEVCDDGTAVPNDGCEASCRRSLGIACTSDPQCDSAICNGTCRPPDMCGNGELEAGEACDDGNVLVGDGCSSTCTIELDTDGDGVRDEVDVDDDNDGLLDTTEGDADTDGDGVRDRLDLDSDNDGIADANEAGHGRGDTNGDFRIDCAVGFRPSGYCLALGTYTIGNADGDPVVDYLDLDADNDGLSDLVEGGAGCTDADDDGVCDRGADADHDGIADSLDPVVGFGTRGTPAPPDTDRDGTYDFRDLDSDGDGRWDLTENTNATALGSDGEIDLPDSDNDGIRNAVDTTGTFGGLRDARVDTDGDGRADFQDADDDGDDVAARDNCPLVVNADQRDVDGDGIGDACDDSDDRWGVAGGGCATTSGGSWILVLGILALVRRRALLALLVVVPVGARAQPVEGELALERFQLASDGDGVLDVESARVRDHLAFDLGLWLGYANDPLTVYRPASDERAGSLVKNQVAGEFVAAIGLGGHLQLGAALPLTLSQSDDLGGSMFTTPGSSFAVGDVRAIVKLQLLHQARHGVDLGVVTSVTFPTSSGDGFAGEGNVTAAPALAISRGWASGFRFAIEGGYRAREQRMLGVLEVDDELFAGAGIAYDLAANAGPPIALELAFSYATAADDAFGAFDRNYAEIKPGLAFDLGPVRAFVAGGAGVAEGYGTPDWRVLAGLRIDVSRADEPAPIVVREPEPVYVPPADSDGDGLVDTADACPREPEDKDGFEDTNGCPDPDNDFDRVLDAQDGCPTVAEDRDGFQDGDGCPDFDNDGDKVLDGLDQCPAVPGPNLNNGCPANDKDNDTVVDTLDNCPDWPGKPAFNGCNGPQLVQLTETQLVLVTPLAFTGTKITPKSLRTLDAAALVLKNHVELKIAITAAPARAEAVRRHLVRKGIAAARLAVAADAKASTIILAIVK